MNYRKALFGAGVLLIFVATFPSHAGMYLGMSENGAKSHTKLADTDSAWFLDSSQAGTTVKYLALRVGGARNIKSLDTVDSVWFSDFNPSSGMGWGEPAASAAVAATHRGHPVLFGYEVGASMVGLTAPARRVGLFLGPLAGDNLTTAGQQLFDAAVEWAANCAGTGSGQDAGVPLDAGSSPDAAVPLDTGSGGGDPPAIITLPSSSHPITVSNTTQLNAALANAYYDEIILANGSYSRFNVTRSVVIRAQNVLGAVASGFDVNADNVYVYGVDSTSNVVAGNNSRAANFRMWRCRFIGGSSRFAIRLVNAPDFDGAYCEIAEWAQGGGLSAGFAFSLPASARAVWRYSMFRDTTVGGSQNAGEAMHWSFGTGDRVGGGMVYRCKFKNWNRPEEEELISVKCSGNVFRQISVENCGAQAINNRFGGNNLYDAIWTRNSGGIGVHDGCANGWGINKVLGCRVDNPPAGRHGIMVRAGQYSPCTLVPSPGVPDGSNAAAGECVVSGSTGPVFVGRTYSNALQPARRTRIRQHSGSIDLSGTLPGTSNPSHVNTDSQPGVAETLHTWSPLIWLEDGDVGPFAGL